MRNARYQSDPQSDCPPTPVGDDIFSHYRIEEPKIEKVGDDIFSDYRIVEPKIEKVGDDIFSDYRIVEPKIEEVMQVMYNFLDERKKVYEEKMKVYEEKLICLEKILKKRMYVYRCEYTCDQLYLESDSEKKEKEMRRKIAEEEERLRKIAEEEERLREIAEEEDRLRKIAEEKRLRKISKEERIRKFFEEEKLRKVAELDEWLRSIAEEERLRKIAEEERFREIAEKERLRKIAEEERLRKIAEEQRLRKNAELEERLRKISEKERLRIIAAEERLRKIAEEERLRKIAEEERLRKIAEEEERLNKIKEEEERLRNIAEEKERTGKREEENRYLQRIKAERNEIIIQRDYEKEVIKAETMGYNEILEGLKLNSKWNRKYDPKFTFWKGVLQDKYNRGDGFEYFCPIGWTRYGIMVKEVQEKFFKFVDGWNIAYHGTSVPSLFPILSSTIRASSYEKESVAYVSPCIEYCAHPTYSRPYMLPDNSLLQVILQCRVNPTAIREKIKATLLGEQQDVVIDSHYQNSTIEWKVLAPRDVQKKEERNIIPYGVMVRKLIPNIHPDTLPSSSWWPQCHGRFGDKFRDYGAGRGGANKE